MLQEVLLALSGHPSPLFPTSLDEESRCSNKIIDDGFPLSSPSEAALLECMGKLALSHRRIRSLAQKIIVEHPSTICRAVGSSILHLHLARFQKKITEVEKQILTKDAALVGAYNIVPLSAVVGEFDEWSRRMEWYWKLVCYIQGPEQSASGNQATGALLIDHLRAESHTGFPDIESVSVELSQVADKAWLKQLSVWLLYGQTPSHGARDFFVTVSESSDPEELDTYTANHTLLPKFVSRRTAESLMFIGKSLHQIIRHHRPSHQASATESVADAQLLSEHLHVLSTLTLPLIPSAFSTSIAKIRSSLSQKVLQRLLPIKDVEASLNTFRQFFLLGRGEFAMALIGEAQASLNARQSDMGRFAQDDPTKKIQGVTMKEGEVTEALARTWKTLTTAVPEDMEDEILEFAREHLRLEIAKTTVVESRPSTSDGMMMNMPRASHIAFNDMLLPVAASLTMHIRSPLDLFISRSDVSHYANINAYLIALRRSHGRLSDLWRFTPARRDDPKASPLARSRARGRVAAMRKVWATCSAGLFLLSETTAYFEGEVIGGAWDHFFHWVTAGNSEAAHDPETLSSAHRLFLSSLTHALLLTDTNYTKTLRSLLSNVDNLVAHFVRLQQIQKTLDLDAEAGITSQYAIEDEKTVTIELDRARKRVDSGMKDVVARLRHLDDERLGDATFKGLRISDEGNDEHAFEPWQGGGIERLLMKLDFGRVTEDEMMHNS